LPAGSNYRFTANIFALIVIPMGILLNFQPLAEYQAQLPPREQERDEFV